MNDLFVLIDGGRVRYWDSGGTGPAVLMTHGIAESLEFWHRQFDDLGQALRLIAWDMPGHGLSDELATAVRLEEQAGVAWKLLDQLGVDQVHLVGNSLGAAMSLRMADQMPARVSSLVLCNSAALGAEVFGAFKVMTLPWLGELMNRPGPMAVAQQIKAIVLKPEAITPQVRAAIERNVHRPGAGAHFLKLLRALTSLRGQRQEVWSRSHQILRGLGMPTRIVHGEQDVVLPIAHAVTAQGLCKGSELVRLQDCGHTPQLEQPEVFNALLRKWFL
ncbi:MAG: alpha/beta fold hydrolase [Hydrogenophaga sp.]|uniref:alpha/beta fold hydrolase n=1 Tax=Hydrogenophaga sp. TaxID=1904254 RepID=UPI002720E2DD|nr:alpha/beta fold hydrolase [Hydrogenophaga sp.]MDO9481005.1 alpha/beta fold hydrolase [Hydrogenophaga sp.]MDP1894713.1 alpha/beta fold hydrolase [Hydrogenophaga sp.]MDP3345987.1 alpha/beta fold hydrolase [Hydrogenophaga sp.]MDP3809285.1 alpha/beta fold hydrolase [Hydrogenophaga sp.]MDP3923256.1 alpha/beta fold hydrolase [Hydrogenophaga sp.]